MATGTVGLRVGVVCGLTPTSLPPTDEDEGPSERKNSHSSHREHQILYQRRVDRRHGNVKLTHTTT